MVGIVRLGTQALALLPIAPDEHELCRSHAEALENSLNRAISLLGQRHVEQATARPPEIIVEETTAAVAELLGAVTDVVKTCGGIEARRIAGSPADGGGDAGQRALPAPGDDEPTS